MEQVADGAFERVLASDFHVTVRSQNQHAARGDVASEEQQEAQTRCVCPVQVLEQNGQRAEF
jgi:hypothetical protein